MSKERSGIVALLTDFGEGDWYAGTLRGVILSRCPTARLFDITHSVPPGDIRAGAFILLNAFSFFPAGTIYLAVVDPGVGGERAVLAVEAAGRIFLAPDNGILSWALEESGEWKAFRVTRRDLFFSPLSGTFHGRDVFAPLAAELASGRSPAELGEKMADPVLIPLPRPEREGEGRWLVPVLYVDRFGNLITALKSDLLPVTGEVEVAGIPVPLRWNYSGAAPGSPVGIPGSGGFFEISLNLGSASEWFGVKAGDVLPVTFSA